MVDNNVSSYYNKCWWANKQPKLLSFVRPRKSRQAVVTRNKDDNTASGHLQVTVRVWAGVFKRGGKQKGTIVQYNHKKLRFSLKILQMEEKQGPSMRKRLILRYIVKVFFGLISCDLRPETGRTKKSVAGNSF